MSNVTPVSEWKSRNQHLPLELPSGKTCLVRPVGVQAFLRAGIIPNSLMKVVTAALAEDGKAAEPDMAELMASVAENPEMLQDVFNMADNVTMHCVVEPQVLPIPHTEDERQADLLYVDEIDLDDKLFILNFGMGGSRDLEAFRQATTGGVGSVQSGQDVRLPPKPVDWRGE